MSPVEELMVESEQDLIRRCAGGDEAAYGELVARIERPLVNFILRYVGEAHLAEDIFQESFVRVVRNMGSFRPEASVTTWIFTIARNLCLDHLKAKKRHREVSLDHGQDDPRGGQVIDFREILRSSHPAPEGRASQTEEHRKLLAAVSELSPAKREAVTLRMFAELSYEEIARIVGSPVGTIKFRVHEAVQELSEKMKKVARRAAEA